MSGKRLPLAPMRSDTHLDPITRTVISVAACVADQEADGYFIWVTWPRFEPVHLHLDARFENTVCAPTMACMAATRSGGSGLYAPTGAVGK